MRVIHFLYLFPLFICVAGCRSTAQEMPDPWEGVDQILDKIERPQFRDVEYSVLDYGAIGDGETDALPAFKTAIDMCHMEGGGTVHVPKGVFFLKGPIHLKSNIHLALSDGAVLIFSNEPEDFLPIVKTRWEGAELMNYSPLIYAYEAENIAITGKGIVDGQADDRHWWPWCGKKSYGWEEGMPSQRSAGSRPALFRYNIEQEDVENRKFGAGTYLRPNFLQPYRCRNVLIQGITLRNAPMWVVHPVLCENVIVDGIRVESHGPNNDGCNPESCKNVLIQNCYFDTGDDCIAIKSGRNQDGHRINTPSENIVIRDCQMKDGHGGVVIGSEVSGGARNIYAENCTMSSPNLDRAIRIKTNRSRGGTIENLYYRNIEVGEVREAVIKVNMLYTLDDTTTMRIPVIRNIHIDHVTSTKSTYALKLIGYDEKHPIGNMTIRNCRFNGVGQGTDIQNVSGLSIENSFLNGEIMTNTK